VRRARIALGGIAAGLAAAGALAAIALGTAAPSLASVRAGRVGSDALLVDRRGAPLHEVRVDPRARRLSWTPLDAVSPALVRAVVRAEDRRFFEHPGVDVVAIASALRDAALGRPLRGASTLTMQLAKQLARPPERGSGAAARARTSGAKWREVRLALALERRWSKAEVLEAYLNLVSFRGELQGIDAAARGLFGKSPDGVGAEEAAVLAALLPAPAAPAEAVAARACRVARRLDEGARCDEIAALARRALAGQLAPRPRIALAPHLVARLAIGPDSGATFAGVRRIATTLDARVQRLVAGVLERQVLALADRNVRDAAAIVVDNASGDVLAYVGSSGPLATAPHVDAVRARRQAGSTLKPFLYALAFEQRRITPATRLDDAPLDVPTALGAYRPENYDHVFRGPVAARAALASSLNVPAVRVLGLVGVDAFVARLRNAGLGGLRDADFYGASLALGSADVTLFELAGAYRALATGGIYTPLRLRPDEAGGDAVRVVSAEAAFLVADALSDRGSRAPTFGLESALATPSWSAVKTGTSKDMRDNWCLGFSSRVTIGVWVGNASGAPMWEVTGVDGAAPAWLEIFSALHEGAPSLAPAPPPGVAVTRAAWAIAGTEAAPAASGMAADAGMDRITSPHDGAVLALDPDIPDARERLLLGAEAAAPGRRLVLDGADLGPADTPLLWAPRRGRHELVLVDSSGRGVDRVTFRVR
jgi:penicillin-binding protein 1C